MKCRTFAEFERMAYAIAKDLEIPYVMRAFDMTGRDGQDIPKRPYVCRMDTYIPRFFGPSETISIPLQWQRSLEVWFPSDATAEKVREDLQGLRELMDAKACEYLYGPGSRSPGRKEQKHFL